MLVLWGCGLRGGVSLVAFLLLCFMRAEPAPVVPHLRRTVVVVGGGPSGCTAATYLARAGLNPLLIAGYAAGGQLMLTGEVENFPGHDQVQGADLMASMLRQARRNGAEVWNTDCTKVSWVGGLKRLVLPNCSIDADVVVVATGADAVWLNAEDESLYRGRGISTCAVCDGAFFKGKDVVVVGGGDSAMEQAIYLAKIASSVRIIHRSETFRASKTLLDRVRAHPRILFLKSTVVEKWIGDGTSLTGATIYNQSSGSREVLRFSGAFIAVGHVPNTKFLTDCKVLVDQSGHVITAPGSLMTQIPGVFACGDVVDKRFRQAVTAAGAGCQVALEIEEWLMKQSSSEFEESATVSVVKEVKQIIEKQNQVISIENEPLCENRKYRGILGGWLLRSNPKRKKVVS